MHRLAELCLTLLRGPERTGARAGGTRVVFGWHRDERRSGLGANDVLGRGGHVPGMSEHLLVAPSLCNKLQTQGWWTM